MKWGMCSATTESCNHVTVWGALGALAVGTLLGSLGMLCSRWVNDASLLGAALGSAFPAVVLAVLAPVRPQDLFLDIQSL